MIKLMGTVGIDGVCTFPKKGFLLIAILTLSSGKRGRLELATQMWENSTTSRALTNLRYVIAKILKWEAANATSLLDVERDRVGLSSACHSDVSLILHNDRLSSASELDRYLSLWEGELLQFEKLAGPEVEHTILEAQDRIRRHFLTVVLDAVTRIGGASAAAAFDLLERISPLNEAVARAKISHLCESGRPIEAASYYRELKQRLRFEFNTDAQAETDALVAKLFDVYAAPAHVAHAAAKGHDPVSAHYRAVPRILVLPPATAPDVMGTSKALAQSMVTDLTLHLARMRTFAVIAPFTAKQLATTDPLAAAVEVEAPYVVSTRLSWSGQNLQLWVALINTIGEILLADSVPVDVANLAGSQEQIADSISQAIAAQVSTSELLRYRQTGEASAFVHYLLGSERLRYDLPAIRKAKRHFNRALRTSPGFAPALAMSARALNYEWLVLGRSSTEIVSEALSLAQRAIDLDPLAPNGHWEVGHSLLYLRRLDESLDKIRIARKRGPHLADLMADEADVLVHLGRFGEAVDVIDRAISLNPGVPDEYLWVRGSALYFEEDYERAVLSLCGMRDTMPVSRLLAASFAMLGNREAAAIHRDRWLDRYPDFKVKDWAAQIPVRNVEVQQRMIEGMRQAGFA